MPDLRPHRALGVSHVHPVHIAAAAPEFADWDALLTLLRACFAYMDARIDPPSSLARLNADDLRAKARDETLIVATLAGALVGCAFAAVRADCVYLGKVAVAERVRRQGVARGMFAVAETLARAHGRGWLELQTRVELIENHRSFAALGFHEVARTAHAGHAQPTSVTMRRAVDSR